MAQDGYVVAVVGAGLVGERLVSELRRREFPVSELRILARTARTTEIAGETFEVGVAEPEAFEGVDLAFFAGTEGEKGAAVQLSGAAIERGAVVIDNGSDFRLDDEVPLVVPEVNAEALDSHKGLVANANCSTTQMVVALAPLAREFGLKKVVVSTYQAVSGSGREGVEALENGREGVYPKPIERNAIPLIGSIGEDGYSTEETKMRLESRKILSHPDLEVFATTVRIPVHTGHAESVYVELGREVSKEEVLEAFASAPGIVFSGDANDFPTPLEAAGEPGTFVGRVRVEGDRVGFWCVADNLLKGAATNAVQIAESLIERSLLGQKARV
ncbi:Aspartate-semialdehyde dehydrogenase [Rubrobacter radiotolerans]|uniref:Aspartate-semialdehyde dehydrogenase n=1 Tax=Rubrobacter radiotolerans TaxID=42256 RepID=A0A023X1W2_RUBRA|nr:aspartate-semialdehyde dehydrogenase [Rubrobacter radiotolerans]AHY46333.1 Aspartate-semialdehyde dehydrogenase [Rubrobacter radiotolerans]MDX5893740.1 aspartate-semialdehyde dehydrogenase [Rubrobacter radiotolerans]SMC04399.1 aspartate-semialdehyde dehydrogenase [Rubrobacter radiotolerans DSM 5868]